MFSLFKKKSVNNTGNVEMQEKLDKKQKTFYTKIPFVIKLQGNLRVCLFFKPQK